MHTRLYTLRTVNDRTEINFDLTGKIISENIRSITVELSKGPVEILKENWINRDRVYDDGKVFFLVCTKNRNLDHVKKVLIAYAIKRLETRAAHIEAMRDRLKSELQAA